MVNTLLIITPNSIRMLSEVIDAIFTTHSLDTNPEVNAKPPHPPYSFSSICTTTAIDVIQRDLIPIQP